MRLEHRWHLIDSSEQRGKSFLIRSDDRVRGIDDVQLHRAVVGVDNTLYRVANVIKPLPTKVASGGESTRIGSLCVWIAIGRCVAIKDVHHSTVLNDGIRIGIELHERSNSLNTLAYVALINDSRIRVEEIGYNQVPVGELQSVGRLLDEGIKFHPTRTRVFSELCLAISLDIIDLFA